MAPRAYYAICGVGVDGKHEAVQDVLDLLVKKT